jgi:alanine-glyoxylate transaminase/serine-glyoxylate transaminase/serine-pyruvate transaminase
MDYPVIDHRGPEFQALGKKVLSSIRQIFQTTGPVVIYPASGTGAWEAALVNTLSPGDQVLMVETGHFAALWKKMADKLGLAPEILPTDWRHGVDAAQIENRLAEDRERRIRAVCVVHNETSTGVTSNIAAVRAALDRAGHPALLLVDTISSLASVDYRHDEWGVDVTVAGSQKGLMLPPGLSFNAISTKALAAAKNARLPKAYWGWSEILAANENGFWPYTPATSLLYGLAEACDMLLGEGLPNVFARHLRLAEATRRAVAGWGLEILCQHPAEYSPVLTAIVMPEDGSGKRYNADDYRRVVLENFNMSLGQGLGKLSGWVFRIGHLGDFNDLTLLGALAGVEAGFLKAGIPHRPGGTQAAIRFLAGQKD